MGGIIGLVAAFLYCVGYYRLVIIMNEKCQILGWLCFGINCLGIICGGAYHSHCAYFGLIGRHDNKEILEEVHRYLNVQQTISFGLQGIGFLILALLIIVKCTVFSRWMFLVSPGILFLLFPLGVLLILK